MWEWKNLNPQQRRAVQATEGPLLVLAGAGTGKTRVITSRILHLIHSGVPPEAILAVTFTNKAAREMQERLRAGLPPSGRSSRSNPSARPTICTFHSLGVRILRESIEAAGRGRNFVIYTESDQLGLVKKILSRTFPDEKVGDAAKVVAALSRFKCGHAANGAVENGNAQDVLPSLVGHYQDALRACNAVDFDDLILLPLQLLTTHPELREKWSRRFRYVMVDEYQDTNPAQFQLLYNLTRDHRNVCVVGDDDQSIYGWRGAVARLLLDFDQHYPQSRTITLEQNYRSTNAILKAANALIRNNPHRNPKELWSRNGEGQPILLQPYGDEEEEAEGLAEAIEYHRKILGRPWRDHVVLIRTNRQSRPLEAAFRRAGVRYRLVGGQSYFDRREVKDLLAYLKFLLNPKDDISLLRIANVPARGLSDRLMHQILETTHRAGCSVWDILQEPARCPNLSAGPKRALQAFAAWATGKHRSLFHDGSDEPTSLEQWTDALLEEIGYYDELCRLEKTPEAAENRIRHLKDLMATMDADRPASVPLANRLETFLDELSLDDRRESTDESSGEAVVLMTIHSCKGLEFPHVWIAGLEEGLLPHSRSLLEDRVDEERRLFYVALTRARQTLALSYCLARKKGGKPVPGNPSRFLKELPEDLIESADAKSSEPVSLAEGKDRFAKILESIE